MMESVYDVDCAVPSGNIIVDRIDGDDVFMRQDLRDTAGSWFYWCFRVCGAEGRTVSFHFTEDVFGARGPAISTDNGGTWHWLGREIVEVAGDDTFFKHVFRSDDKEVIFSVGMPYHEKTLEEFLFLNKGHSNLKRDSLCVSRKGRQVERLSLGCLTGNPRHRVLLTCRHHCCEMMASYALEGIMEAILADTEDGRWLCGNVEFLVIPFVDKDGVEDGDQGKNRRPHDHNRDYKDDGIYPETKALRELVPGWSQEKLKIVFDLHCPWLRGAGNESFYFVGSQSDAIWRRQCEFSVILESVQSGAIAYSAKDNVPYGQSWNVAANWASGKCFSQWAGEIPGVELSASLEIPYASANGKEVDAPAAREFGHDLAKAIRIYLGRIS